MSRWEFHLSRDETGTAARWAWMYRVAAGETTTSATTFATYRDCLADALLHGYNAYDGLPHERPSVSRSCD